MAKEWTDDEIRAMIADSRKIVEEDRERGQYATLHEKYGAKPPEPKDPKAPPPKQEPDPEPEKKARRPLWPVGYEGEE